MAHAELTIIIERHPDVGHITVSKITLEGCKACLINSLKTMMLTIPKFKEILNQAVREANIERQKKEN